MTEATAADLAAAIVARCTQSGLTLATAESCTGGLVAAAITDVPGASAVMERGFVTYSNEAKTELLGVAPELIEEVGAVSAEVAAAMVSGALQRSPADLAVAVTGVAGPDGGTAEKPVGLVHLAAARRDGETAAIERRYGNIGRDGARRAAVVDALRLLDELSRQ